MCPSISKCIFIKKNNMPTKIVGLSQPWKYCIYIQKSLRYVENASYLQHSAMYRLTVRYLFLRPVLFKYECCYHGEKKRALLHLLYDEVFQTGLRWSFEGTTSLDTHIFFERLLLINFKWFSILYQFDCQSEKKISAEVKH